MSTYNDLLAVIKYVRDRTGDPNAWQSGLTPDEVSAVVTAATRSEQLDEILCKIRQQHSGLFAPAMPGDPGLPRGSGAPAALAEPQQGDAAQAIGDAEAALAHQNSASSQLDLQVISAILNAHLTTVEGREALNRLQQETEGAIRTRSDLDTPAGARDFQRFLITKLRDIRAVVANASLDDTSKSALMAAWTSLYGAAETGPVMPSEQCRASSAPIGASAPRGSQQLAALPDAGGDPYLDSLLLGDPSAQGSPTTGSTAPPMPMTPMMPSIPNLGAVPMPGGLSVPGSIPGGNVPNGLPLSSLLDSIGTEPEPRDLDDEHLASADPDAKDQEPDHHKDDGEKESSAEKPELAPTGPTTVTLPDGETVTAASSQLAAAIKAAVGGASIADAFRAQGITIPPPGTAVTSPIDPSRVTPGDVGIFTDRHALALGHSQALLDGQIQHISAVTGPSFLGWERPPTQTAAPTPTWPAAASTQSR